MRFFVATGLSLCLSISGLLAGAGCISAEVPDPDSGTGSAGVKSAKSDGVEDGSSGDGEAKPPPPPSDDGEATPAPPPSLPPPPALPPPPPLPETCWSGELGDGVTCSDSSDLKDEAYITCRNQGADLAEFTYERELPGCSGSETTGAVYACCPAAEPLPSPTCWTTKIDHGDECQAHSTLDAEASALCGETGQQIFHIWHNSSGTICPETYDTSALLTCCP
ncbi:hypothetical protein [Sorangium sp. So ce693]|uniref:hypothetical protein n=1 Tax=Sorangium sp. So ce693 TaxID=3133318 RepID=UPI003F6105AE